MLIHLKIDDLASTELLQIGNRQFVSRNAFQLVNSVRDRWYVCDPIREEVETLCKRGPVRIQLVGPGWPWKSVQNSHSAHCLASSPVLGINGMDLSSTELNDPMLSRSGCWTWIIFRWFRSSVRLNSSNPARNTPSFTSQSIPNSDWSMSMEKRAICSGPSNWMRFSIDLIPLA